MSPRKMNDESDTGVVDDWGIAFEGLSLDTKLYPKVGLYQTKDSARKMEQMFWFW